MSLDTVVEDIREEARARADEIREEADEEAAAIIAEAEHEADAIIADRKEEVEEQIAHEGEQSLSSAKLEAKQERLATRRDLLSELRSSVEGRIQSLEGDRREALTDALLTDAIGEFSDDATLTINGRSEDAELLSSLVGDIDRASVGDPIECLGGVEVESDGTRITIDNTFDAIIDEMWEDNIKQLSDRLFGPKQ